MTTVSVKLPSLMRRALGIEGEVPAHGDTVGQALQDMEKRYSNFRELIWDENGNIRAFVLIALNDKDIRQLKGMDTPTTEGDTLFIVTAVAGG